MKTEKLEIDFIGEFLFLIGVSPHRVDYRISIYIIMGDWCSSRKDWCPIVYFTEYEFRLFGVFFVLLHCLHIIIIPKYDKS